MPILLFLFIFLVFWAYFGYPLSLYLLSYLRRRNVAKAPITPPVTFIITAFNEEKRIREKLENTVALDYPADLLQVVVASDGSTDRTNDIVREYQGRGVVLLEVKDRGGKENAQKEAVAIARGDILVFSDTATIIEPDSLYRITANFADSTIGCVSSVDRVVGRDGKPCGEGAYVRYEMWLRDLEGRVNSLVGLSGSFFAARKEVCRDFSPNMQSDFRTLLNSMRLGLRGVGDTEVIGLYQDVADSSREFDRKVRTVLRGITVFFKNLEFLNPFRYGLFAYQFCCHKLLRWLVPFFLTAALLINAFLAPFSPPYLFLFLLQCIFYLLAVAGWKRPSLARSLAVKLPLYFATVNLAIAVAWVRYLRGNRLVMWTPSER
ncbi:glycosyltransferase family 2 protein [Geomonas terrae]|uniref:Glycosyltransferase family 2 protein n=1 Tax=Geomonas terrae TaxID=2562681 RepID=A0A4S1CH29_9BACT|nr:glycosyltransferase family 2 protein [Geomonas terrae]TGU70449.1 glycosyltransferase family 2 protein [Geomonas terrae]TGU72869.1 glycosyltransferase family 2 protein [Geomonas terrae]